MKKRGGNKVKEVTNSTLNAKVSIIHSKAGLIKKDIKKISQYFPDLYSRFNRSIKDKFGLFKHVKKSEIKKLLVLIHHN